MACAALLLGKGSPKPQPPSRSWAMTGPAHLPEWNPQHPEAQSASDVHEPVMNCVPLAAVVVEDEDEVDEPDDPLLAALPELLLLLPDLGTPGAASALGPWIFCAALLLGVASPKPQPPSRS